MQHLPTVGLFRRCRCEERHRCPARIRWREVVYLRWMVHFIDTRYAILRDSGYALYALGTGFIVVAVLAYLGVVE